MSPEATTVWLLLALVAFLVGAALSWARPWPQSTFFLCVGLAAWVIVPLWTAMKAL